MQRCFVIQPFDRGPFDKRFDEILDPAIKAADLEAYRVDRDPGASIPIQQIQDEIRNSKVCLADITQDNPNVWFELGFAIASGKEVVLVCSEIRSKFPFDIQHRNIITYKNESPSDFEVLKEKISKRLSAIITKEGNLEKVSSSIAKVEGLSSNELVALVALAQNLESPTGRVSTYDIKRDMETAGYTKIAFTVAMAALIKKDFIESLELADQNGERFTVYILKEKGLDWLVENQDKLQLKILEEDIPF